MKYQVKGEILCNTKIGTSFYNLKICAPQIALHAKPGQFMHIKCNDDYVPLLRRPMSIFNVDGTNVEIIYHLIGTGTEALSKRKKGELLDIIGPLGNGFNTTNSSYSLLVGGGMGLVPLFYLAKKLEEQNKSFKIFYGAKSIDDFTLLKSFQSFKNIIKISTDDGSKGFKGRVTELLKTHLESIDKSNNKSIYPSKIYSCGPKPMLKALQQLTSEYNIECEISLEEYMGCGVGACLSCVCKTKDAQYKRVCVEGPIFRSDEIFLE